MKPLQHLALYAWALHQNLSVTARQEDFATAFIKGAAWTVLPEAYQWLKVPSQATHFEMLSDKTDCAKFWAPAPDVMKKLKEPNGKIRYYVPKRAIATVIGEDVSMDEFFCCNLAHPFLREMGTHLVQEKKMRFFKSNYMVECSGRFNDFYIPLNGTMSKMNGETLKSCMQQFDEVFTFYLIGKLYECTGILMDNAWLRSYVLPSLKANFSPHLVKSLWRRILLSKPDEMRVQAKGLGFRPAEEELQSLEALCTSQFMFVIMDKMLAECLADTCKALSGIFA